MKRLFVILIAVAFSLLLLGIVKDMVIKASVEKGVEIVTCLKLNMGSLRVGLLNTRVDIRNLRLFNPQVFKDRLMADMPEIYVDYNLSSLIKGRLYLTETRINLKEFTIVKNESGELNLNSLKVVQAYKQGRTPSEKVPVKALQLRIDDLRLKIGRVIYKDYSRGGEPFVKEFEINLDERYKNINDPYLLVSLIVVKAMANTSIAALAGFDLNGLMASVSGTISTAQTITTQTVVRTEEVAKKSMQTVTDTAKTTKDVVKETTGALTEVFKNPFDSKDR